MSRTIPLDPDRPVGSLLEASGLTAYALARRATNPATGQPYATQTIDGHVARAGGIGLDVLRRLCVAAGYELRLSLVRRA